MNASGKKTCLLKTESTEELLSALESLRRHHTFRSRQFTDLYEQIIASNSDIEPLTARETETLHLIAKAKTIQQIAVEMAISTKTVQTHRDHLFSTLGVHSAVGLVVHAVVNGLLDLRMEKKGFR